MRQAGIFRGVTGPPRSCLIAAVTMETRMMTTEHAELGRFLRTRRAGVRPADVGLPVGAGPRRTPGLRREELATLAGVSIDYYTRLERGKETRPSPAVVDALARALRLDDEEHEYLRALAAQAARRAPVPPRHRRGRSAPPSRNCSRRFGPTRPTC